MVDALLHASTSSIAVWPENLAAVLALALRYEGAGSASRTPMRSCRSLSAKRLVRDPKRRRLRRHEASHLASVVPRWARPRRPSNVRVKNRAARVCSTNGALDSCSTARSARLRSRADRLGAGLFWPSPSVADRRNPAPVGREPVVRHGASGRGGEVEEIVVEQEIRR